MNKISFHTGKAELYEGVIAVAGELSLKIHNTRNTKLKW